MARPSLGPSLENDSSSGASKRSLRVMVVLIGWWELPMWAECSLLGMWTSNQERGLAEQVEEVVLGLVRIATRLVPKAL